MVVVSDVVIHILSKLPPESLLRFKSVCKTWYALINDPKFVTKHLLDSSPHKHVLLKRIIINNSGKKEHVFSLLKFSLDRSVSSILDIPLPLIDHEDNPALRISGHSHGLICLSDSTPDIFLCNPMTRQFRKLPPTVIVDDSEPQDIDEMQEDADLMPKAVGFGYDVQCGDFKVVRVMSHWRDIVCYPSKVEIYDLRKDRWREIKTTVVADVFWQPSFDTYHEGTFYWFGLSGVNEKQVMLTFDMSKEVFGKISLPESFHFSKGNYRSLMVLNGSLCLFSYPPFENNEIDFEIWEMEKVEYDVVSWSKLLTIGPLFGIEYPIVFLSANELLMESKEGQLILYDFKTQQIKELHVRSEAMWKEDAINWFGGINLFVKSLVSL